MALIQPSKFLKIDYGMQGWTRLLDLNFHRLNSVLLKVPQLGDVYAPNGVQDKDILVWDATHERWVVTRFYDYFPLPTATGDVICTNLKISAADGYAFVDFAAADVLTDHVPYHSKLIITDSAGKKLIGYIKAAGTGETYGAEQVKNPTFDADATSWLQYGCTLTSSYPAGGGHNNDYGILTSKGSGEEHGTSPFILQSIIMPTGCLCTVGGHIKNGNKPNREVRIYKTSDGYGRAVGVSSSSWSEIRGYFTERGYNKFYIQAVQLSVANETVFIDEIFCRQVLTPSATGVTITSTPDGEVYNWASVDEGFDFYDPAGYTYTIEGQVEP